MEFQIFYVALFFGGLLFLYLSIFIVEQQSSFLIERFGKFVRTATPGLNFKIPFIEKIAGRVSLRILQLDVEVETKTLDNVFIKINTSVQFNIIPEKIYQAYYTLDNPQVQIQSFVFDVVRAKVPNILLDDIFSKKDEIASAVKEELHEVMNGFGYHIIKALVTDINPDHKVKTAMNEINEAQRLRVAANERGEAEKILKIKAAEAEAQSHILQGEGIAGQRKAIIEGLRDSISEFQKDIHEIDAKDVMSVILVAQYFDTLKEMAKNGNLNSIMLPHSPAGVADLQQQIREGIISGNQVVNSQKKSNK